MPDLDDVAYAERLAGSQQRLWKRVLGAQVPYRWLVRRLALGRVLDVGCGIGRNLSHLNGRAVGVDTNPVAVDLARERGFRAFTPDEFFKSGFTGAFDTLLASHVLEHVGIAEAPDVLREYLSCLNPIARLVLVTPQESGFNRDPTHVAFLDFRELRQISEGLGFVVTRSLSFPFPRPAGRVFPFNEFVVVGERFPASAA